jgi:hypothetical protein
MVPLSQTSALLIQPVVTNMFIKNLILSFILTYSSVGFAEAVKLTFKPVQKNDEREVVDNGAPGASTADSILGHGIINDLGGKEIGHFHFVSFVTEKRPDAEVRWLHAQYAFGNDSILIEGARDFMPNNGKAVLNLPSSYPVTGGTGKYAGARGECRVIRVTDNDFHTVCKFQTIKIKF